MSKTPIYRSDGFGDGAGPKEVRSVQVQTDAKNVKAATTDDGNNDEDAGQWSILACADGVRSRAAVGALRGQGQRRSDENQM